MIQIKWHLLWYIISMLVPVGWAIYTRDNWLHPLEWLWVLAADVIITAIYGGIVWW